jgi:hypothetical protein
MNRTCQLLFALSLVVAGASGCAFGDRQVALQYPPPADAAPAPAVARAPQRDITIVLARFSDDRTEKTIGEVRNGWGMHTADVLTDTDVTTWIARAIARDLKAAGYTVRKATAETAGERVQISGQVLTTYCRALMAYEGEVSFFVQVSVDGEPVLNKRFAGRGSSGVNWAATGDAYGESLAIALREAVAQLSKELRVVLEDLPPPPPPPETPAVSSPAPSAAAPAS